MVKEDKAKGKAKVLARRNKDKDKDKKTKSANFFKTLANSLKAKVKNKGKAEAMESAPLKDTKKDMKKATSVKVKSGNTLSQIAKSKGITLKALLAANPDITNPNKIRVGQNIKIPAVGKGGVYEGMSKKKMASMAMKNGGTTMKKKTKYMAKGGMKKTKYMAKGGATKKTKYMAKGGMKKTKMMSRGGAARRK